MQLHWFPWWMILPPSLFYTTEMLLYHLTTNKRITDRICELQRERDKLDPKKFTDKYRYVCVQAEIDALLAHAERVNNK